MKKPTTQEMAMDDLTTQIHSDELIPEGWEEIEPDDNDDKAKREEEETLRQIDELLDMFV